MEYKRSRDQPFETVYAGLTVTKGWTWRTLQSRATSYFFLCACIAHSAILKEMNVKTLCVFCASAMGAREEYQQEAEALGRELATRGIGLVYGGAKVGLMGAVANASMQNGGRCIGVIPHVLVDKEVANHGLTELHVVDTMHTRKALMGEKSDAFLILPGGYGTMEELFEVLTWQSLRLHAKPTVLLNTRGFYDPLLAFLDHCVTEGVLKPDARKNLMVATTVEDALDQMEAALSAG